MTNANATLDDLRGEIDEIDGAIHDLLMRRAAIAERIGAAKDDSARDEGAAGAADYLRPAREAAVLRRLAGRHRGSFPLPSLVRLWREIMSSLLRLQGPFSVAVFTGTESAGHWPGYWDLARDHYGSTTPMTPCQSPVQVLREVSEKRATVGVLPFPEEGETAPWWPLMASGGEPKVIARLPFLAASKGAAARAQISAMAVACLTPEETGDDRSLLALEIAEDLSRARLVATLAAIGLPAQWQIAGLAHGGQPGGRYLIETEGFVASEDPRLGKLAESLGPALSRVSVLGAYAAPLTVGDEPARRPDAVAGRGRP